MHKCKNNMLLLHFMCWSSSLSHAVTSRINTTTCKARCLLSELTAGCSFKFISQTWEWWTSDLGYTASHWDSLQLTTTLRRISGSSVNLLCKKSNKHIYQYVELFFAFVAVRCYNICIFTAKTKSWEYVKSFQVSSGTDTLAFGILQRLQVRDKVSSANTRS